MRIGIHVGDIVTGVTGSNVVRFNFYGENVVIANKMESEGLKENVNVSESAKELILQGPDLWEFKENKPIQIKKNTGNMSI